MKTKQQTRAAIDAFLAKKIEIDQALKRLAALSDNHFDIDPESVDWGHVGNLDHIAELLKHATRFAFSEDESLA